MNTLTSLMTAAVLSLALPLVHAEEKPAASTAVTVGAAASTPAIAAAAAGPRTRAEVRAELEQARQRGELEAAWRWGVDTTGGRADAKRF